MSILSEGSCLIFKWDVKKFFRYLSLDFRGEIRFEMGYLGVIKNRCYLKVVIGRDYLGREDR